MKKLPSDVRQASRQKRNRFRLLMTGALDGEFSLEEEREFQRLLSGSSACRWEWNAFKRLRTAVSQTKFTNRQKKFGIATGLMFAIGLSASLDRFSPPSVDDKALTECAQYSL